MTNKRNFHGEKHYIWQADDWPNWRYDLSALTGPLTETARFLAWANEETGEPALVKAGLRGEAHEQQVGAIAKCSPDTALRDITQLLERGVLKKSPGGGRSAGYDLAD